MATRIPILLMIFLLGLLCYSGCNRGEDVPESALALETLEGVYLDLLLSSEGMAELDPSVPTQPPQTTSADSILARHKITRAQIEQTMVEFRSDIAKWREFFDNVMRRLEELRLHEQNLRES